MPVFYVGEIKTAIATMSNPTGKSFAYTAELYLGLLKAASSGVIPFSLAPGETRNISFPVTMPSAGTYPVYLDVLSNSLVIGAYKATEDVVVKRVAWGPPVEEIFFSVRATFPPKKREYWGDAPWQYIDWLYIYTGRFVSPALKAGSVGLSDTVGTYYPHQYSSGYLDTRIFPAEIKDEYILIKDYYYYLPKYIAGELQVTIYLASLDDGGAPAYPLKTITSVNFPITISPDARIYIDLRPYCPPLE